MIEISFKSIRTARTKYVGLVGDFSELTKIGWAQEPPVGRVGKKNKPLSVHSYTLFCTVERQAKQPVAEELAASDWRKTLVQFARVGCHKFSEEKTLEYGMGWKVPIPKTQDKCKAPHSSSSKRETGQESRLLLHSGSEACTHDSVWLVPRRLPHDHLASKLPVQDLFVTFSCR